MCGGEKWWADSIGYEDTAGGITQRSTKELCDEFVSCDRRGISSKNILGSHLDRSARLAPYGIILAAPMRRSVLSAPKNCVPEYSS
jgi:hypothetical protein